MGMRLGIGLLLVLGAGEASGAKCAGISGSVSELEQIDGEVRLRFIRDRMKLGAHRARIWTWTWAGIYSTLTVGNLALLGGADRDGQIDDGVGAGAAAVGVLTLALAPQEIVADQYRLERRLRRAPPGTDVCALLADAERWFIRDAKSAAFGKGVLVHAGNFLFNIGVGFLLGFGFNHWDQAAIQGLVGIVVGEVQIISQPAQIVSDLRRYRAANLGLPPAWRPIAWGVAPMVGQNRAGLVVGLSF
jgi:hypothetical protein